MRKKAPFTSQYADGSGMGVQGYKKGGKTSKKGGASVDSSLPQRQLVQSIPNPLLKKYIRED